VSPGDCRTAAARIRQEVPALDAVAARAEGAWAEATGAEDDYLADAAALNLHGFYAGLERVFVVAAERVDGSLPGGTNWHQELLWQMASEITEARPAVLDADLAARLDDFHGFRHVVRNVYLQRLDDARVGALIADLPGVWEAVSARLTNFADALEAMARD
jgi:hypothetical protein